jgi:nitronate monooxygenase
MISTRLTELLGITHPIIQAPMAIAAGGRLAAAVTEAGGLGMIGGGYGDSGWLVEQFAAAGEQKIGCGFITWSLEKDPSLLAQALEHQPAALMLSFGDPTPFVETIKKANVTCVCQVQTLRDATRAVELGVDIVVAQGAEAGGHGESRATFTLVPEIADFIEKSSTNTLLCAAGGISDGRGLAAALMLGAEGVLIGSRFWASNEALVHPNMHQAAIQATGDDTIRSSAMDIARNIEWPERYTARVLRNEFTDKWHHDIASLKSNAANESEKWRVAWLAGDVTIANTYVGEATGRINSIDPAGEIVHEIVTLADKLLKRRSS